MPIGNALTNDLTRAVPRCLANDYRLDNPRFPRNYPLSPIFAHFYPFLDRDYAISTSSLDDKRQ